MGEDEHQGGCLWGPTSKRVGGVRSYEAAVISVNIFSRGESCLSVRLDLARATNQFSSGIGICVGLSSLACVNGRLQSVTLVVVSCWLSNSQDWFDFQPVVLLQTHTQQDLFSTTIDYEATKNTRQSPAKTGKGEGPNRSPFSTTKRRAIAPLVHDPLHFPSLSCSLPAPPCRSSAFAPSCHLVHRWSRPGLNVLPMSSRLPSAAAVQGMGSYGRWGSRMGKRGGKPCWGSSMTKSILHGTETRGCAFLEIRGSI